MRLFPLQMVAAVIAVLALACSPNDGPTRVAEAFYNEMASGNIEAAKVLSTPDTAELLGYLASMHDTDMFSTVAEGGAAAELVKDDRALVSFVEGDGYATVPLVRIDGEWKVDFATMIKAHAKAATPVQLSL